MPAPRRVRAFAVAAAVCGGLLAGCAGPGLRGGGGEDRDGPDPHPPAGLLQVPDAEPKVEPIRAGGPNKPYTVWGQDYVPLAPDAPLSERGLASWYGRKFSGKPTASGELYDMYAMTAAHPTLPIPSYARIRNPANGREVVVRINDRGPFKSRRIVDVSYTAALKLDILRGATPVELVRITADDIRTGAWRHEPAVPPVPLAAPVPAPAPADPLAVANQPEPVPMPDVQPVASAASAPEEGPKATSGIAAPAPIDDGVPARAGTPAGRGFWVQLGAFRQHDGALEFRRRIETRVDGIAPLLTVFGDASLFRLQAGPYPSREAAADAAERLRGALKLVPVIVERR